MGDSIPSTSNIEIFSISYLKLAISQCLKLKANILENDKTPSWDGSIEVYNSENMKKTNLEGIVPVQVKGKWSEKIISKKEIKYSADIADLVNYQKNGGVIFFVIYCNKLSYKIYYASLLPIDLDNALNGKKEQQFISITLKDFPKNNESEIFSIFKNFIYHSKKQIQRNPKVTELYLNGKMDLTNKKLVAGYSVVPCTTKEETIRYILKYPTYSYLRYNDSNIDVVLGQISIEKLIEEKDMNVEVDGEILDIKITREYDRNGKKIDKFGNNIKFNIDDKKLNFRFANNLSERIKDLKFLKYFLINYEKIDFSTVFAKDEENNGLTFKDICNHLNFLCDVQKVLNKFEVDKELILKDMLEKDWNKIAALVKSVLYEEVVPYSLDGDEGIGIFEFGNIKLLVACLKSDIKHRFKIRNIFDLNDIGIKYNGSDMMLSVYFECLRKERLLNIDNINYDKVYDSIINFRNSEEYDTYINWYVLELIGAYDVNFNIHFLILADKLLNYLIERTTSQESIEIYKVNHLQIKKRQEKLDLNDKMYLFDLKRKKIDDLNLILCCNILLESFDEAEIVFQQFSNEEQKKFKEYPIFNIWK